MNNVLQTETVRCTGCSACMAACPVQCILLQKDEDGFLKPVVDTAKCIHCGKCNLVCPLQTPPEYYEPEIAAAAITKDRTVWQNSTSGGAFYEICRTITEHHHGEQIRYFGAAWDTRARVVHRSVERLEDIVIFQKSKYIQSDAEQTFREVRDFLVSGCVVVYSGTPCQIAGLRNFISRSGAPDKKLYLIDFICHGVGSPDVFSACLEQSCDRRDDRLKSYTFRWKQKTSYPKLEERYVSHLAYESGRHRNILIDDYNKFFLNQLCLNTSCMENCSFRHRTRCCDFTIADFNGFNAVFPDICDHRHYSTVIANTAKARQLMDDLRTYMDLLPCSVPDIEKYQACYNSHRSGNPDRDAFFAAFKNGAAIKTLISRFVPPQPGFSLRSWLKSILPYPITFMVMQILRKIRKRGWTS